MEDGRAILDQEVNMCLPSHTNQPRSHQQRLEENIIISSMKQTVPRLDDEFIPCWHEVSTPQWLLALPCIAHANLALHMHALHMRRLE